MHFNCVPRWPFPIGNPLVVFNIGLVGLVQGLILSSLPMAVVPGITITITLLYPTLMGYSVSFPSLFYS